MKLRHLFTCALASVMVFMACEQEKDLGTPNVTLSTSEIILPQAGGDTTLTIIATRDWSVKLDEAADWLVVDPSSGSASASEQTVTVSALSNDGYDREASVGFTIGMQTKYLTVKQEGPGGSTEALVVYSNDFDISKAQNNGGWPYLDSNYDLWDNKKGTGSESVTYAFGGKMSVRTSGKLSNDGSGFSHYSGSGMNKVFFGVATSILKIQNITLDASKTDYALSFGGQRYTQDDASNVFSFDEFKVYVSNDAEKWVPIAMSFPADADLDGDWNLASAKVTLPSGTEKLSIAFVCTKSSAYSIDDVLLELASEAGQAIDFSKGEEISGTTGGGNTGGDDVVPESKGKKTVAEFIEAADKENYYELTGKVSSFNPTYCSFDLTDDSGKIYVYSVLDASKAAWTSKISNGGTITIYALYDYYEKNSQHEVVKAHIVNFTAGTVERPTDITDVTVEEFLKKEVDDTWYRLSGTVSGTLNTTHGNFDLTDETGSVYVYGIDNWSSYSAKFAVGDKVTIVGHRYIYTNPNDGSVKDEVMDAYIESWTAGEGNTGGGDNGDGGLTPPSDGELDPNATIITLDASSKLCDAFPEGSTGVNVTTSYTIDGYDWTFSPSSGNKFSWYPEGYVLWGKENGYILLPSVEGKSLSWVLILTGKNASVAVQVGVYSEDGTIAVTGGEPIILNAKNSEFTYNLSDTEVGARYRFQIVNDKNAQFQKLTLIYE